jgi:hypothetical protein
MSAYTGNPELETAEAITNNGFFPDLTLLELAVNYRVPNEYEIEVIKDRLITAMIDVNTQLIPVRDDVSAYYPTLASYCAVHSDQIDGVEVLISKYKEAVFSYARSFLLQRVKPENPKEAYKTVAENQETENYWRNKSLDAISYIFKRVGVTYTATGRTSAFAILV